MELLCPVQEWEEPPEKELLLEGAAAVAMLASGVYVVARYRRRLLPLWLSAFISCFTLNRYLVCTRCERYGERCEFYGMGRYTARLFQPQADKSVDNAGFISEGATLGTLYFLPLLASKEKPGSFMAFTSVLLVALITQFLISCRRCAMTATTPWKAICPNYRLARKLFT